MNRNFWAAQNRREEQLVKACTKNLKEEEKKVQPEPVANNNIIRVYHF